MKGLQKSHECGGETMINRLSAILCGLVVIAMMSFVTARAAEAAVPAALCIGNWVNAPCLAAPVKATPAAPRVVPRVVAPRREVHRSKRIARQRVALQKPVRIRVAARTASVCTGNWVNAACATP
jgi:hypothetical protein